MSAQLEGVARARDLCRMQLTNQRDLDMADMVTMLGGVRDEEGGLEIVSKLLGRNSSAVALAVIYSYNVHGGRRGPEP
jgi:hypothetical protein